jgi:hypothetical protein
MVKSVAHNLVRELTSGEEIVLCISIQTLKLCLEFESSHTT